MLYSVVGGSWLGCRDCQPWERYFSSWAQAPNLHKVISVLGKRRLFKYCLHATLVLKEVTLESEKEYGIDIYTNKNLHSSALKLEALGQYQLLLI